MEYRQALGSSSAAEEYSSEKVYSSPSVRLFSVPSMRYRRTVSPLYTYRALPSAQVTDRPFSTRVTSWPLAFTRIRPERVPDRT